MKVKIFTRGVRGLADLDFPSGEGERLVSDFARYLETGAPKGGVYKVGSQVAKTMALNFDAVSVLEYDG